MRVILSGGEHVGGLAAIRGLRRGGYEPWAAVSSARSYAARSRATAGVIRVPDPVDDPGGFSRELAAAARCLGVAAVLPGVEAAHLALAAHLDLFPNDVAVGTCAPEIVLEATNKAALERRAREAGLVTPPTSEVGREELVAAARLMGFPVVIKPRRSEVESADGRLAHAAPQVAAGEEALLRAADDLPGEDWLVQPYLNGSLGAICGVVWRGEIVCAAHQRAERIWPPRCGVSSFATTVPRDSKLERGIQHLLAGIGWSGLFQAQFINTRSGRYLIDLNPRVYGSLALAIAAGLNLPALWTDLLIGRRPQGAGDYRVGVRYRAEEGDVRAIWRALAVGDLRTGLGGLVPRPRTTHAVFALRDPRPFTISLAKLGARARARGAPERG